MFFVCFENNLTQTEEQIGKWDNIVRDRRVKRIGILLPIQYGDRKLILPVSPLPEHCDKYCCSKLGRMIIGEDNGRNTIC